MNCNTKLDTAAVNSTANKHGNRTLHKFQSEIQLPVGKTMVLSVEERTFGVIQKRNKRKQKERNRCGLSTSPNGVLQQHVQYKSTCRCCRERSEAGERQPCARRNPTTRSRRTTEACLCSIVAPLMKTQHRRTEKKKKRTRTEEQKNRRTEEKRTEERVNWCPLDSVPIHHARTVCSTVLS